MADDTANDPRWTMRGIPAEQRLWIRVVKGEPDECWLWMGRPTRAGYGQLHVNGRMTYAHRFSYELHYGPIPDGMYVCHTCDVRNCVNPRHLWLGTHLDNIADAAQKGKYRNRSSAGVVPRPVGTKRAKLSPEQVIAIRADRTSSTRELATQYGVGHEAVARIRRGQSWKGLL